MKSFLLLTKGVCYPFLFILCLTSISSCDNEEISANTQVVCEWKCHCARQVEDCDPNEEGWEICLDVNKSRQLVDSCEECKRIAQAACAQRVCPPDPNRGPKHLFQYWCDQVLQEVPVAQAEFKSAIENNASLSDPDPADSLMLEEMRLAEILTGDAGDTSKTCKFRCGCTVERSFCDQEEAFYKFCVDKTETTVPVRNCDRCTFIAFTSCWRKPCPIIRGTRKTMTSWSCD